MKQIIHIIERKMKARRHLALLLLLCATQASFPQKMVEPDDIRVFNITVNEDDRIIKTQMLHYGKSVSVHNERTYLWYGSQKIHETTGGYDGRLIHGQYRSFYFDGQLKEQGKINYGIKTGEWKYWNANGKLKEIIHWKRGVKHGAYTMYNDLGQVIAKGSFKDNKLHGKFYTYNNFGQIIEKKKYKDGHDVSCVAKEKAAKEKPVKEKKKKNKKEKIVPEEKATPEENAEKPQSISKKPSWFQQLFKKKKKEPAVKPVKETEPERKIIHT